jgi:hypothetical protein
MNIYQDVDEDEKVNDEDDKLDEENGEGEDENEEEDNDDAGHGKEEDVDEEADKRYWEAKAKEGHGVRRVLCLVISDAVDYINKFTQPKKSQATRDIRLSFQQDARLVDGVVKAGAYCRWCL